MIESGLIVVASKKIRFEMAVMIDGADNDGGGGETPDVMPSGVGLA